MHRRSCLKALVVAGAAPALPAAPARPIQLHVDLDVTAAKEKELVANYRNVFRPAISKQPGFVSVRLLKFRNAVVGQAPANAGYRLVISFQTEEQRQTWANSPLHNDKAWPSIESNVNKASLKAILYDEV